MTKDRHEASTKYVDNFVIEVIKAKQRQKEKSTEVFAKLCRYDGTNIPVEGKIKAMCEYGENWFQDSMQPTDMQNIGNKTATQWNNIKGRSKARTSWSINGKDLYREVKMIAGKSARKSCSKQSKIYPNKDVSKSLQRSRKDESWASCQVEGRHFINSASI